MILIKRLWVQVPSRVLAGFASHPCGFGPKLGFGWVQVPASEFKSQSEVNGFNVYVGGSKYKCIYTIYINVYIFVLSPFKAKFCLPNNILFHFYSLAIFVMSVHRALINWFSLIWQNYLAPG